MAKVKGDISETQNKVIHMLREACKTQKERELLKRWDALSLITKTCSKGFNYGPKCKTTARDKCQLNSILISKWFVNCGEISKTWNDVCIAISWSITIQRLCQFIYDRLIPKLLLNFKQKQNHLIWASGHQSSVINQNSVFLLVAKVTHEIQYQMHEKAKMCKIPSNWDGVYLWYKKDLFLENVS